MRETSYVRVDDYASFNSERITQHDVCRLACDARQLEQLVHLMRNLPSVFFRQTLRRSLDRLGLIAKEAGRLDVLLQLARRYLEVVFRLLVLPKQISSKNVDALVRALR